MKHKDLDSFTYLDSIQVACPEEHADASELPEEMLRALYPHVNLGPAFPQILQMHKELHFTNAVAVEEAAANAILETLLEKVDYTSVTTNTSDPIHVIYAYTRKRKHLGFISEWEAAGVTEYWQNRQLAKAFMDNAPYGSGQRKMVNLSTTLSAALTISVRNSKPSKAAAAEYVLQHWHKCVNDIKELQAKFQPSLPLKGALD